MKKLLSALTASMLCLSALTGTVSAYDVHSPSFDRFVRYDLCITDYDSLPQEKKDLAQFVYQQENGLSTFKNYSGQQFIRARKILRGEDAGERLTLEQLEGSYGIYDGVTGYGWLNYINCVPDVFNNRTPDARFEYWLDDEGKEKVIYSYSEKDNRYRYYISPSNGVNIPVKDNPFTINGETFNIAGEPLDFSEAIEVNGDYYYITPENKAVLLKCGHCPLTYDKNQEPINEAHVIASEINGCPVTAIENCAMTYAPFTEIVLPDTLEYIGNRALSCDYLEKVNFPKGLKYIGEGAVHLNCDKLEIDCPELVMGNDAIGGTFSEAYINAKEIGEEELMSCYYLKKVVFGDAVEKIDACVNYYYGKNFKIESVELPEGLRVIGQGAFKMDSLKEITIPKSVEIIGAVQKPPVLLTSVSIGILEDNPMANTVCAFNPDCVIKGYKGTEAERYANEWGLTFVALDKESTDTIIDTTNDNGDIYGDADEDGKVGINDAVKIMSYVNNASKYELTEEAKEYADVYNNGDGVNNMDALAVQQKLAGIIEELPVSYMGETENQEETENQNMGTFKVRVTDDIYTHPDYFENGYMGGIKVSITPEIRSLDGTAEIPEIAFEPVEKYTVSGAFTEFELPKYFDEAAGLYYQYHLSLGEVPEGLRLPKLYNNNIEFNFPENDNPEIVVGLLDEEGLEPNLSTATIKVEPPFKRIYTSEDKEIDTTGLLVTLYLDGRKDQNMPNLSPCSGMTWENRYCEITVGTLENVVEGRNLIPVYFRQYKFAYDDFIEATGYFEIEYIENPKIPEQTESSEGFLDVKITDDEGNPVPDVKVFITGTYTNGTDIIENDGAYVYSHTHEDGTIGFSLTKYFKPDEYYISYHAEIQDIPDGYVLTNYPDGFDFDFRSEKNFEITEVLTKK